MNHIPWSFETMPLGTAVIFSVVLFLALILAFLWWDKWRHDSDLRAIRRKRRRERRVIAQAQSILLARHDPAADRVCFRDSKGLAR